MKKTKQTKPKSKTKKASIVDKLTDFSVMLSQTKLDMEELHARIQILETFSPKPLVERAVNALEQIAKSHKTSMAFVQFVFNSNFINGALKEYLPFTSNSEVEEFFSELEELKKIINQ